MSSRTVVSPNGARIEIVSDEDWAATAGVSLKSLQMWSRSKPLIIRELWEHGPAEDRNGGATAVLWERIQEHYPNTVYELGRPTALNGLVNDPVNAAAIQRTINGKRSYKIELVAMPQIWYDKLTQWDIGGSMPTYAAIPVESNGTEPEPSVAELPPDAITDETPSLIEPFPESLDDPGPSIDVEIAGQVAMELLTRVVEIISAGSSDGMSGIKIRQLTNDLESVGMRLAQRLEENDRMRKQLRQTGDELAAVKMERDSLRQRLRQTEANLNSALKGESAHAVTTEVMKRVDRIMRETPKPHERGDE